MTLNGINSGYPTTETTYTQKESTSKATAEAAIRTGVARKVN